MNTVRGSTHLTIDHFLARGRKTNIGHGYRTSISTNGRIGIAARSMVKMRRDNVEQ